MSEVPPVRLAIAGYGLVGRRHATAIAQCPDASLVAIIDPVETAQEDAKAAGYDVYPDLEAFFANGTCDGMILATPNALHVDQALLCVQHACPVLIEKPIATLSSDAARLVEQAEDLDMPLLVGHHRRYNPIIQTAKHAIDSGQIGTVRAVQATCWLYKPDAYFDSAEWRKKPGAGPVSVNLVHDIDLIRYLCGEVRKVRAFAAPSARGYDNEDVSSAVLELASGAITTVSVSDSIVAPWSWELTSKEYPIYPPTSESAYMIGGSHGSLSIPDLRLWTYADGQRDWWSPISATALKRDATDPLVNQIVHFAAVIRKAEDPLVTGREGLRTLQVIEAIQQSAASDRDIVLMSDDKRGG